MNTYLLILSFFIIAVIYSSVGFGGGSSYLAILSISIFGLIQTEIRATALLCNLIVATSGTIIFYRSGKFKWADVWPYIVASVPMAFIGGTMKFSDRTFFLILAFTLMFASFFLWFQPKSNAEEANPVGIVRKLFLSGGVGFISGLVSIGGGIFLSPLLHLLRWNKAHTISGIASVFILANSISGLLGLFSGGIPEMKLWFLLPLLGAVFVGGQIGSRLGANIFNIVQVKRTTAFLILVASLALVSQWW